MKKTIYDIPEKNSYFWNVIKTYNKLMEVSIEGPDCTDPEICRGDCCSIQIDVPKVLAKEYIDRGYANKSDFVRSDIFAFKLALNPRDYKCVLFDGNINGCSVHKSGIKPPQCWIYPTRFSNSDGGEIKCKRMGGWKIIDNKKIKQAEKLLEQYKFLCLLEAKKEIQLVGARIENRAERRLLRYIMEFKPTELGGFQDSWNSIVPLSAEGFTLQLKKFCMRHNPDCNYLPDSFMECERICGKIAQQIIKFLKQNLYKNIVTSGADRDGKYPFFKLFEFTRFKSKEEAPYCK